MRTEEAGKEKECPLVSMIVRTCSRPQILKRALDSIRRQTYPNIEVIIVEDGKNTAEKMLRKEFADLRYIYEAAGKQMGRSKAGNRAMQLSSGKYLNFLDDDDMLFPMHVATLVKEIEERDEKAVYAVAQEWQITDRRSAVGNQQVRKRFVRYRQPFNRLLLYTENYIPIQSVLFERSLFAEMGGLDEGLDAFEDWDLWVRYSLVTDFIFVDRVTSCYLVPCCRRKKRERAGSFKDSSGKLYKKFQRYQVGLTVSEINKEMLYMIRQYKENRWIRYLRMFVRVVLLGER